MTNSDLILWGIGTAITVILGIFGAKKIIKGTHQTQKTTDGSTSIQSGRDTKIK